jgi:ATP-binding cassette subfamily F protein 3
MLMLEGANFLIFDEPTNHLDVESIEALEDAIDHFDGTVLLVSHDRELLRRLVTRVWELRDGHLRVFDGDFVEWEETDREQVARAAVEAEQLAAARERERVAERKRAAGPERARTSSRNLQRAVEQAEADVLALESRVAELTARLADPALYADRDTSRERADALSKQLAETRDALSRAMAAWEAAMEAVAQDG